MANQPGEFSDVARLTRLLHEGHLSRRDFIIRAGVVGLSATALAALVRSAPVRAQTEGGQSLPEMETLIFGDQGYFEDPSYVGPNAGGLHGRLPVGGFPNEKLSFLDVRASQP